MFDSGKALRIALKRKKISRREFAETLGVSKQHVWSLITGKKKFSIRKAEEYAGYFGVKLSQFIRWGEDETKEN